MATITGTTFLAGASSPYNARLALKTSQFLGLPGAPEYRTTAAGPNRGDMIEATQSTAIIVRVLLKGTDTGRGLPGISSSITVKAAKGGTTAFSTITPSITDMGSGWYALSLTTSHTDTLGVMNFRVTCPSTFDNDELAMNIIAVNKQDAVRMGLTALPNATAGAGAGVAVTDTVVDAVWDEVKSGHTIAGTMSTALSKARRI